MYILPRLREDVHAPSREVVHLPFKYFRGGCTSSLRRRMYILLQPREDVLPPAKGRCTSSPEIIQVKLYILLWREDVHPSLTKGSLSGLQRSVQQFRGKMFAIVL